MTRWRTQSQLQLQAVVLGGGSRYLCQVNAWITGRTPMRRPAVAFVVDTETSPVVCLILPAHRDSWSGVADSTVMLPPQKSVGSSAQVVVFPFVFLESLILSRERDQPFGSLFHQRGGIVMPGAAVCPLGYFLPPMSDERSI